MSVHPTNKQEGNELYHYEWNDLAEDVNNLKSKILGIEEDLDDIVDEITEIPIFTLTNEHNNNSVFFKCWVNIDIERIENAGTYEVAFKPNNELQWTTIIISQPQTGNPSGRTPYLEENTLYDFKLRAKSQLGRVGEWSEVHQINTSLNNLVPEPIQNLNAVSILNGVMLEWDWIGIIDGIARYRIYKNIVDEPNTAVVVGETTSTAGKYIWFVENPENDYIPHYFWVVTVNSSGIEGPKGLSVNATPTETVQVDWKISMIPWSSDLKIWEDSTVYGKFYWANNEETDDATIQYDNETTATVTKNLSGLMLTEGLTYFYKKENDSTLHHTTVYSEAVGEDRNFMALIDVKTDMPSTILPFNSYTPTIGAGAIAAKSIRSQHLVTDNAIITNQLQIGESVIVNDHLSNTLTVSADKILLMGEVTLSSFYTDDNGVTSIDGGKIATESITANKIASSAILIGNLEADVVNRLFSSDSKRIILEGWQFGDTTYIDGGNIYAGTITLSRLDSATQYNINNGAASYATVNGWRHPFNTTKIDGGEIYTGSITSAQINTSSIEGLPNLVLEDGQVSNIKSRLSLSANDIIIQGAVTFNQFLSNDGGVTRINGAYIATGTITATKINTTTITGLPNLNFTANQINNIQTQLTLSADQINIIGTTKLSNWRYGSSTTINGGYIQAGTITADKIQAGTITADKLQATLTITGNVIRTASTGDRVELNALGFYAYGQGVWFYDLSNNLRGNIRSYFNASYGHLFSIHGYNALQLDASDTVLLNGGSGPITTFSNIQPNSSYPFSNLLCGTFNYPWAGTNSIYFIGSHFLPRDSGNAVVGNSDNYFGHGYFWNLFYKAQSTSWDAYDDLGLVRQIQTKKIDNKEYIDNDSIKHLRDKDGFINMGDIHGWHLSVEKKLLEEIDGLRLELNLVKDELLNLKDMNGENLKNKR